MQNTILTHKHSFGFFSLSFVRDMGGYTHIKLDKVAKLPKLRNELQSLETELTRKAERAMEDLVLNPPEPITDMRRCNEHRITYVGKKTKQRAGISWSNMFVR